MPVERARRTRRKRSAPWVVVTGIDGGGKSALVERLFQGENVHRFRLPYHSFVASALNRSGHARPLADVLTDRLIFATDARLANYLIRDWRAEHALLVSQRGWMDNYIFGAAQGVAYRQTAELLKTAELERPSAIIYLIADPRVAYKRIRHDPQADKFETPAFLRTLYREIVRFHDAVRRRRAALGPFFGIPALCIDTTHLAPNDVLQRAEDFLRELLDTGK